MKKRIISIILSLAMVLGMTPLAGAATDFPYLCVDGQTFIHNGQMKDVSVPGVQVEYTSGVATLTLNGANLSEFAERAIDARNFSQFNIVLAEGTTNSISSRPYSGKAYAIYANCNTTISGGGTLNISLNNKNGASFNNIDLAYGIYVPLSTLTICDDATVNVNINVSEGSGQIQGVNSDNIVVAGGNLSASVTNEKSGANNICLNGNITFRGGSIAVAPVKNASAGSNISIEGTGYTKTEENGATKYVYNHQWQYGADGNTVKCWCSSHSDCTYGGENKAATVTINAEDAVYTPDISNIGGNSYINTAVPYSKASVSGDFKQTVGVNTTVSPITYEGIEGTEYTASQTAPKDAGRYKASAVVNGYIVSDTFAISKADMQYTAPQANTLTYNGSLQELVTAGSANVWAYVNNNYTPYGTVWYRIGTDGQWSNDVPMATEPGTYDVYWKVEPVEMLANNFNSYQPAEAVKVTINKKTMTPPTAHDCIGSYDGRPHSIEVTDVMDGATVTYSTAENGPWTAEKPTVTNVNDSGKIYFKVSADKYQDFIGSADVIIQPADIAGCEIAEIADSPYTGTIVNPTVNVTFNGQTLVNDVDFTVDGDSGALGEATAMITGAGNFTGTTTKNFKIVPADIANTEVTFDPATAVYTGQTEKPQISVYFNGFYLLPDIDFSAEWVGQLTDAGTYTVKLSGLGNFCGNTEKQYTIGKAAPAADLFIFTPPQNLVYDGTAKTADIAVKDSVIGMGAVTVVYYKDGNMLSGAPVNAGDYTVGVKTAEGTNYLAADNPLTAGEWAFTIAKTDPQFTAPAAKTNLVYTAAAQQLVTAGSTEHGKFEYDLYKISDDDSTLRQPLWAETLPEATDAGTYRVSYRIVGDENHLDSEGSYFDIKIEKATPAITSVSATIDKDKTLAADVVVTGTAKANGTEIAGSFAVKYDDSTAQLALGKNTVAYTFTPENANYNTIEGTTTVYVETTKMDSAETALEHMEQVLDILDDDSAATDNEAAADAVVDAMTKYNALSDAEKAGLGSEFKTKLDAAKAIVTNYKIIHGANGSWIKGSSATMGFTANGAFKLFKEVKVDGKTITRDTDYKAQAGSTIVTLTNSYLKKLSAGSHNLEIVYDVAGEDISAVCSFKINEVAQKDNGTVKSVDGGMDMITVDGKNLAGFDRLVFEYTVNVPYEKTSVTLGGKTSHPAAKADNLWEIPLNVGENVIVIKTTAENEDYNWFYTIKVNRAPKFVAPQATAKPQETPQPSATPQATPQPTPTPAPDVPSADTAAPQQAQSSLPIIPIAVAIAVVIVGGVVILIKRRNNGE